MAGKRTFAVGVRLMGKDDASRPIGSALNRIGRQARKAEHSTGRLTGGLSALRGAIVGVGTALAGAAIARQIEEYAKAGDELAKFSRSMDVGVEALQEWRHAAERVGVGGAQVDRAFAQLTRRVGEVKAGVGELGTFLGKVSPEFMEQVKAAGSTEEAMTLVIRALEKIEDPSRRAALASRFFGEELGLRMTRFADAGTDAINGLREEARRYGLISDTSARQAEAWQDNMQDLKMAIGGVKNAIGSELLPVLTPYIEQAREWIVANRDIIAEDVAGWISGVGQRLPQIIEGIGTLAKAFGAVADAIGGAYNMLTAFGKAIGEGAGIWLEAFGIIDDYDAAVKRAAGTAKEFSAPDVEQRVKVRAEYLAGRMSDEEVAAFLRARPEQARQAMRGRSLGREGFRLAAGEIAAREEQARAAIQGAAADSPLIRQLLEKPVFRADGEVDVTIHVEGNTQGITVSKPRTTGAARATMPTVRRAVGATP